MEFITPLKEKIIEIPHIQINEKIRHFFSTFFIQSIIFMIWTPFVLSVPAYLFVQSFGAKSFVNGFVLFLIGGLIFGTWSFISGLFLYSVTEPRTKPRYVALSWVIVLLGTFITWIVLFMD